MTDSADASITFTAGRYSIDQSAWEVASNSPSATISLPLFRVTFDAVGEETIEPSGTSTPASCSGCSARDRRAPGRRGLGCAWSAGGPVVGACASGSAMENPWNSARKRRETVRDAEPSSGPFVQLSAS